MISNCGHDENGRYSGGKAGDQGGEWVLMNWYNRPWNCVLRHPNPSVQVLHGYMARMAALNDNIGYDQYQRDTFGMQLKAAGDDPAKIKIKCETDCSKGIIDITKAIGRRINDPTLTGITATYTGNMRAAYKKAGYEVLTDKLYLTSDQFLQTGDILLNDAHHTATVVSDGHRVVRLGGNYLHIGFVGPEVAKMQKMLIAVGYSCGEAGTDGDFGEFTEAALMKFQKDKKLVVDGVYGSITKAALKALYLIKKGVAKEESPAEKKEPVKGDKVTVNGTVYGNGNGTGGKVVLANAEMYVVDLVDKTVYPNYIGLAYSKGGTRIGWTKLDTLS